MQAGMGEKIGMTQQALAMFFAGFGIGFYYSWELTLVILAVTPALVIVGAIFGKIMGSMTSIEQTAYAEAGSIAEEAFSSIHTVVAFCGEQDTIARLDLFFNEFLVRVYRKIWWFQSHRNFIIWMGHSTPMYGHGLRN